MRNVKSGAMQQDAGFGLRGEGDSLNAKAAPEKRENNNKKTISCYGKRKGGGASRSSRPVPRFGGSAPLRSAPRDPPNPSAPRRRALLRARAPPPRRAPTSHRHPPPRDPRAGRDHSGRGKRGGAEGRAEQRGSLRRRRPRGPAEPPAPTPSVASRGGVGARGRGGDGGSAVGEVLVPPRAGGGGRVCSSNSENWALLILRTGVLRSGDARSF